ncbi:sugar ABC transporter permease [Mesorhizobium sp. SARCC-RB16n]|uniref:ABC transporter permease n=1 Tax=Mesorhizobium sp. SARCC-RB16n TaxID=2116687 RepID=UPI00122FAE44|nr:ABC transporter permease [Mesorhizobium sp. SARCC-RB16n]KAA3441936.1 sugar ABC transporter permease [Mesorhizobium sp. SARCC-RB16n]
MQSAADGKPPKRIPYLKIILRILSRSSNGKVAERREIYERAQEQLKTAMENMRAPLDKELQDVELRILRQTIRLLEHDIRAGVDVWAAGYEPAELSELLQKNEQAKLNIQARRNSVEIRAEREALVAKKDAEYTALVQEQEGTLRYLEMVTHQNTIGHKTNGSHPIKSITIIWALFIHNFHTINGDGPFSIIWLLIQPMIMLAIISSVYLLIGTHYILNMDVPTFALLGSGTWVACRMTIFRVSGQIAHNRVMLNLPMVSPFHQGITTAILYLIVYMFSISLLFCVGRYLDLISLPDDVLIAALYFVGMWLCGLSIGFIFGVVIGVWPFFARLTGAVERLLQMFSSVFYVSEQLPEVYRKYVLWNPLSHGMQLLRGAYFHSYPCTDARPSYFWLAVVSLICSALILEGWFRRHVQPV